jgi:hypothetical protein
LLKKEDNLRTLRSLLRETIKHSRQDFDMNKFTFTFELLEDIRKRYQDFMNIDQYLRERFVVSICDLITVCIFVSITQQAKDAYLKRNTMNRDFIGLLSNYGEYTVGNRYMASNDCQTL